mgnify:CR=1 FL=1
MRKIIYSRADGGVSVVSVPVDSDEAITLAIGRLPADASTPLVVDESVIPTDRTFRNAWEKNDSGITVSMTKARNIQEVRINEARRNKMRELLERTELGENLTTERAQIRALDARSLVNAATTIDELRVSMPEVLK